ncbi:MAG: 4-hydroxythreonine-4-phosphate dehydrogenase [Sulfurospirillum sp.]|nr:4-hydroxythreonine-4-phosphate dehydrogenase [Sulfurospirillum sp.]
MKTLAISIGDLNGIGLQIALEAHAIIKTKCKPLYCIKETMLTQGALLLNKEVPQDFTCIPCGKDFKIKPSMPTKKSGAYAFASFQKAIELTQNAQADAIVTLPINKEAWQKAKVPYKGHTDALADILNTQTIMMLGCQKLFIILYTHHIPMKDVSKHLHVKELQAFLLAVQEHLHVSKIAVLGYNPHAGDNGVIGHEDKAIKKAIQKANKALGADVFNGPMVPDTAFTYNNTQNYTYFVCMYHDQGLIPLKTLYFEESINVSLNDKIIRTSVDHGTAYDIAYKGITPSSVSYLNAIDEALLLSDANK